MPRDSRPDSIRKPRSDGERNRHRLMTAAKEVFTEKGLHCSLDEIARAAGVGIATLYRNFPSREALIAEVYRRDVDILVSSSHDLSMSSEPVDALATWLIAFVDFMASKNGMSAVFDSVVSGSEAINADTGAQFEVAITMLVTRANESGQVSLDMKPLNLLRALAGVANISPDLDWISGAKQLVKILIDGMTVAAPHSKPK